MNPIVMLLGWSGGGPLVAVTRYAERELWESTRRSKNSQNRPEREPSHNFTLRSLRISVPARGNSENNLWNAMSDRAIRTQAPVDTLWAVRNQLAPTAGRWWRPAALFVVAPASSERGNPHRPARHASTFELPQPAVWFGDSVSSALSTSITQRLVRTTTSAGTRESPCRPLCPINGARFRRQRRQLCIGEPVPHRPTVW
jgi:hypothetical protein